MDIRVIQPDSLYPSHGQMGKQRERYPVPSGRIFLYPVARSWALGRLSLQGHIGPTRGDRGAQSSRLGGISVFKGTWVTTLHGVIVVRVLPHRPPISDSAGGNLGVSEHDICMEYIMQFDGQVESWVREYQSGPGRVCGFAAA